MNKILLLILFTSLADAGAQSMERSNFKQIGNIIVFRQWRLAGSGGSISFTVDGGPPVKIKNGHYLSFDVAPGDHVVRVIQVLRHDVVGINVEPGKIVYVDAHFGMWGFTFEKAEDQAQAKAEVSLLKAQN